MIVCPQNHFEVKQVFRSEPDFPIGLRGLSLGPRGKRGPAVKKGGKGRKRKRKEGRTKERRKER